MTNKQIINQFLIIVLLALTVIAVSLSFSCAIVSANTLSTGQDIDVDIVYNGRTWHYSNTVNACKLEQWQQANRGMYMSDTLKQSIVDNLISQGYDIMMAYDYCLDGLSGLVDNINSVIAKPRQDSTVVFLPNTKQKFDYKQGVDGIAVDYVGLAKQLIKSSECSNKVVKLPITLDKAMSIQQLRSNTVLKASFRTSYNNRPNRVCNITRATQLISGTVLKRGETFSFNQVVGKRTTANGFVASTVIKDGKYQSGIGGGVCQVSTTLYNCALLAGLNLVEVRQHSLVPHYVMPSFDAMVSDNVADLKFVNNTDMPIYVEGISTTNDVTFNIYGTANKYTYERIGEIVAKQGCKLREIVDKDKYPSLVYKDQVKVINSGSDYVSSKGYLNTYLGDKLISTVKIRSNVYKAQDRVIARGYLDRPIEDQQEDA